MKITLSALCAFTLITALPADHIPEFTSLPTLAAHYEAQLTPAQRALPEDTIIAPAPTVQITTQDEQGAVVAFPKIYQWTGHVRTAQEPAIVVPAIAPEALLEDID